ncbi:hypothetical protein FQA39_LY02656 [Lamprigera yunnana]|nr:hypothetical protein FQA39_LY02656 [Lamprigera yunnana]
MVDCSPQKHIRAFNNLNLNTTENTYKPRNSNKETKTFSNQHNGYAFEGVIPWNDTNIMNNGEDKKPTKDSTSNLLPPKHPPPCPPPNCCPPSYPPCMYPQEDLWDLQFCRWWGWNWTRRRKELMNKNNAVCVKSEKFSAASKCNKQKGDRCFSWWNKLLKRHRGCSLKCTEKRQLQEMYDTPSTVTINRCYDFSPPHYDCKPSNIRQKYECYCNDNKHMECVHNKRSLSEKRCKRKHQSWLCNKYDTTSSEEERIRVCVKPSPRSSGEEIEYLTLRMQCTGTDSEENSHRNEVVCSARSLGQCTLNKRPIRSMCPCKFKKDCKRYTTEINKRDYSQCKCCCCKHCPCIKNAPLDYPQFCRFPQTSKNIQPVSSKNKEYIIHWPLFRKRCKCYCKCHCSNKSKRTRDKGVSCSDINNCEKKLFKKENLSKTETTTNFLFQTKIDSHASPFEDGVFSSPATGKIYQLNPCAVSEKVLHRQNKFPRPLEIDDYILNFNNSYHDKIEHNSILTAVCDAIMDSHLPNVERKTPQNCSFTENFNLFDLLPEDINFNIKSDYSSNSTDFLENSFLKSDVKISKPSMSRKPLFKKKFKRDNFKNKFFSDNIFVSPNYGINSDSDKLPDYKENFFKISKNNIRISSLRDERILDNKMLIKNSAPQYLISTPNLPSMSVAGLFSAIPNEPINTESDKKNLNKTTDIEDKVTNNEAQNNKIFNTQNLRTENIFPPTERPLFFINSSILQQQPPCNVHHENFYHRISGLPPNTQQSMPHEDLHSVVVAKQSKNNDIQSNNIGKSGYTSVRGYTQAEVRIPIVNFPGSAHMFSSEINSNKQIDESEDIFEQDTVQNSQKISSSANLKFDFRLDKKNHVNFFPNGGNYEQELSLLATTESTPQCTAATVLNEIK